MKYHAGNQYISADDPTAAKRWIDRLRQRARNSLHAPLAGRMIPELAREDIRRTYINGNLKIKLRHAYS